MSNTDHQQSPYTKPAAQAILEQGRQEYAKLVRSAKEQKRIAEGIGRDWAEGLVIDK